MNKYFLLNPEKQFGADSSCRFLRKTQKTAQLRRTPIPKNDVTDPKAYTRRLLTLPEDYTRRLIPLRPEDC